MDSWPTVGPDRLYEVAEHIRKGGGAGSKFTNSLCGGCQMGQVMDRRAPRGVEPTRMVWCRSINRPVPHDITACSAFRDNKQMDLNLMASIACEVTGDEFHANTAFNEKAYR